MNMISVHHDTGILHGEIHLEGSKSIANRVLIIQALSGHNFSMTNVPECDDTNVLRDVFANPSQKEYNVRLAGTAGRFLTAYFACQPGTQYLLAEEGLRVRPMFPLIRVLRDIGCEIESQHGDDRFPLICHPFQGQKTREVFLSENISSQFISALLLLAPTLPEGLCIHMPDGQKSMSYIQMTLKVMNYFGVEVLQKDSVLDVAPQSYQAKDINLEGDWSSASYFFGMAAVSKEADINLYGLHEKSWQGDHRILEASNFLGFKSSFQHESWRIQKEPGSKALSILDWDFSDCPDLFQTLAATTAAMNVKGVFTGMETLIYKETNRIQAMQQELSRCGVFLSEMPKKFSPKSGRQIFLLQGDYVHPSSDATFQTYGDHRMAMALSILALKGPIFIENPEVVTKSYPKFWDDLTSIGFTIN